MKALIANTILVIISARTVFSCSSLHCECSSHKGCDNFLFCSQQKKCEKLDGSVRSSNLGQTVCPPGKYGTRSPSTSHDVSWQLDECTSCPSGSFTPTSGMSSCLCPAPGHRGKPLTRNSQEKCPAGTFNGRELRATNWRPSVAIAWDGSAVEATPCGTCEPCEHGSYSFLGAKSCMCPGAGEEALEDGTAVRPCKPGTFKSSRDCTICTFCEEGKYAVNYGEKYCSNPMPGHYAANKGQDLKPCEPGSYKEGTGAVAHPARFTYSQVADFDHAHKKA